MPKNRKKNIDNISNPIPTGAGCVLWRFRWRLLRRQTPSGCRISRTARGRPSVASLPRHPCDDPALRIAAGLHHHNDKLLSEKLDFGRTPIREALLTAVQRKAGAVPAQPEHRRRAHRPGRDQRDLHAASPSGAAGMAAVAGSASGQQVERLAAIFDDIPKLVRTGDVEGLLHLVFPLSLPDLPRCGNSFLTPGALQPVRVTKPALVHHQQPRPAGAGRYRPFAPADHRCDLCQGCGAPRSRDREPHLPCLRPDHAAVHPQHGGPDWRHPHQPLAEGRPR